MSTPRHGALRILLITHGLPPENVGGVEQHVDGLARQLVAQGHDVHVWAKTGRPGLAQGATLAVQDPGVPYAVTRFGYRYEGLDGLASLYRVPLLDRALAAFLDATPRFDVAHVHHLTGVSTGVFDVLRSRGVASVLTLHDYWSICPRGQMYRFDGSVCDTATAERCVPCLSRTFGGWVPDDARGHAVHAGFLAAARATLAAPDALVVPSARIRAPFVALGVPAERIRAVENAVDVATLRRLPLPDVAADRPLRIGHLGTLIPSKGLDVLVEALDGIPAERVELHIHGNVVPYHGDDGFCTRVFARLTPAMRVVYHGPYPMGRLPEILAGIDLLVAPARWREAFGLTVREALAAGRPVVTTDVGGLQDAFVDGTCGRIVAAGDVAGLRAVLLGLAADRPRVAAMARAARELPVRDFPEMAAELLGVYESGIELARGRASP